MQKILPTDIYCIKKIGIRKWQRSFYWPISDDAYFNSLDFVWSSFDKMYCNLPREERDLVLSDVSFLGFIVQFFHAGAVDARCKIDQIEPMVGPLSAQFYYPNWDIKSEEYHAIFLETSDSFQFKSKSYIKNIVYNSHVRILDRINSLSLRNSVWGIGSYSRLKKEYVESRLAIACHHTYWQLLVRKLNIKRSYCVSGKLKLAVEEIIGSIHDYFRNHFLFSYDIDVICKAWMKRLSLLGAVYQQIQESNYIPREVLVTETAKPPNKTIALALSQRGTRTVGFHHGNNMRNMWSKSNAYTWISSYDDVVCPSKKSAEFYEKNYLMSGLSKFRGVSFGSLNTKYYFELLDRNKQFSFRNRVNNVMLVAFPYTPYPYHYIRGEFFPFMLDLELRLVKLLQEKGFDVIYKGHPDRQDEIQGVFENLCSACTFDRFEKIWMNADALLFCDLASSTFGFAQCTNRPIYIVTDNNQNWNWDVYNLLKRRCYLIDTWRDASGRIIFDSDTLVSSLMSSQVEPDFSYVHNLMT